MLLLTACPLSTSFPLGQKDEVEFNNLLIGTWSNKAKDPVIKQATISEGEEPLTAKLHVDEKGELFVAVGLDFLVWLTEIEDQTFLVLQQIIDGENQETYYVQHITIAQNVITTHDISLLENGIDAVTSIEAYREEVKASMHNPEFLQEQVEWKKN